MEGRFYGRSEEVLEVMHWEDSGVRLWAAYRWHCGHDVEQEKAVGCARMIQLSKWPIIVRSPKSIEPFRRRYPCSCSCSRSSSVGDSVKMKCDEATRMLGIIEAVVRCAEAPSVLNLLRPQTSSDI